MSRNSRSRWSNFVGPVSAGSASLAAVDPVAIRISFTCDATARICSREVSEDRSIVCPAYINVAGISDS